MGRTHTISLFLAVFTSLVVLCIAISPELAAAPQYDPGVSATHVYLPLVMSDSPPPIPPACYEGLTNGGFEDDTGWEIRQNPVLAAYSTAAVHGGQQSMRTGIPWGGENVRSYSPVQQTVIFPESVPADAPVQATLSFWHYNAYGDAVAAASALPDRASLPHTLAELQDTAFASDFFYAIGIYEDNTIDWLLVERADVHTFRETVVDVSRYAGRQIRFQFGTYNDGAGGISRTFIDDASLTICAAGAPLPGQPYLRQTLDLAPDVQPSGIAVKPGGQKIYMAQQVGKVSQLAVLQALPALAITAQIPLGSEETAPNGVALVDAAGRVAVALRDTANAWVVNAETGSSVASIPANWLPDGIAVHDGYGYIANFGNNTITVFDPGTLGVSNTLYVGHEPSQFAVTDGEDLFASMHGSNEIVRLQNGLVSGHFYGIEAPYGLAYEQAMNRLYVANRGPSHTVTVLDGTSGAVLNTLAIGQEPHVLAINATTGHLFVACGDRVKVYRTSDQVLLAEIAVPPGAEEGIAVDPMNHRVYVTSRSGHALSVIQDMVDSAKRSAQ